MLKTIKKSYANISAAILATIIFAAPGASAQNKPVATVQVIEYQAGPSWVAGTPPEKQNLGGHFAMVMKNFKSGKLLANGPTLDDFHGFYIFNVGGEKEIQQIVKNDQGITSNILSKVKTESWQLFMENLGADVGKKMLFVLNYNPGSAWQRGKKLGEQDISKHMAHVGGLFQAGTLLAGGPLSDTKGRYIIAAENTATAYKIISDDPAVQANTFVVQVKPWAAFNRQGIKR